MYRQSIWSILLAVAAAGPSGVRAEFNVPHVVYMGGGGEFHYRVGISAEGNLTAFQAGSIDFVRRDGYCVGSYSRPASGYAAAWTEGGEIYAGDGSEGHFGPAEVINENPLTIERETDDGRLRLTWVVSFSSTAQSVTATATLRNISNGVLYDVSVARFAEIHIRDAREDGWGRSRISAYVFDSEIDEFGVDPLIGAMGIRAVTQTQPIRATSGLVSFNKCLSREEPDNDEPGAFQLRGPMVSYTIESLKPGRAATRRFSYFRF